MFIDYLLQPFGRESLHVRVDTFPSLEKKEDQNCTHCSSPLPTGTSAEILVAIHAKLVW